MKKYVTKLISLLMALCMAGTLLVTPASAAPVLPENSLSATPRAHDVEGYRERIGHQVLKKYLIGYAGGQPDGGWHFSAPPSGLYWSDNGFGSNVDVNFSVSWGFISASISTGQVNNTGATGVFVSAPINEKCKLYIYKDIVCDRYAVYERLIGTTQWHLVEEYDYVYTDAVYFEVWYGDNFDKVWRG